MYPPVLLILIHVLPHACTHLRPQSHRLSSHLSIHPSSRPPPSTLTYPITFHHSIYPTHLNVCAQPLSPPPHSSVCRPSIIHHPSPRRQPLSCSWKRPREEIQLLAFLLRGAGAGSPRCARRCVLPLCYPAPLPHTPPPSSRSPSNV